MEAKVLPGGWTLDDLTQMARWVVQSNKGFVLERGEAIDIAAVALVERLYSQPSATKLDLYRAARAAVSGANDREFSYLGLTRQMKRDGREGTTPSFARYWNGREALRSPFEDAIVERLAVKQVWAGLSSSHRQTFNALISAGSLRAAAEILGVSEPTYRARLWRARIEARRLWHAPEEPSRHWARDHPGTDSGKYNKGIEKLANGRRARRRTAA
jgi:hypothetical protein